MLDIGGIQSIAQSYSPQELFVALVWRRRFNEFDGQEVIADLANHHHVWKSFLLTKPIYAPGKAALVYPTEPKNCPETLFPVQNIHVETLVFYLSGDLEEAGNQFKNTLLEGKPC